MQQGEAEGDLKREGMECEIQFIMLTMLESYNSTMCEHTAVLLTRTHSIMLVEGNFCHATPCNEIVSLFVVVNGDFFYSLRSLFNGFIPNKTLK